MPTTLVDLNDSVDTPAAYQAQVGTKYISIVRYAGAIQRPNSLVNPFAGFADLTSPPDTVNAWYCIVPILMPAQFWPFFAAVQVNDEVVIVYELLNADMDICLHAIALYSPPNP